VCSRSFPKKNCATPTHWTHSAWPHVCQARKPRSMPRRMRCEFGGQMRFERAAQASPPQGSASMTQSQTARTIPEDPRANQTCPDQVVARRFDAAARPLESMTAR